MLDAANAALAEVGREQAVAEDWRLAAALALPDAAAPADAARECARLRERVLVLEGEVPGPIVLPAAAATCAPPCCCVLASASTCLTSGHMSGVYWSVHSFLSLLRRVHRQESVHALS
jgi:hypothetical protein